MMVFRLKREFPAFTTIPHCGGMLVEQAVLAGAVWYYHGDKVAEVSMRLLLTEVMRFNKCDVVEQPETKTNAYHRLCCALEGMWNDR
jgi:hypothetical protein